MGPWRGDAPARAVGRGLVAGVAGTAAMTLWQKLSARLQDGGPPDGGGDEPADPWEQAPTPAKVGRRVVEGVFRREAPPEWIPALTHGMHWGYGTGWGAVFGLVRGRRDGRALPAGLLFATGVWAMSYVQLVPMGLYSPPWRYPPGELILDLSYHLAYGAGLAAGYAALDRG